MYTESTRKIETLLQNTITIKNTAVYLPIYIYTHFT